MALSLGMLSLDLGAGGVIGEALDDTTAPDVSAFIVFSQTSTSLPSALTVDEGGTGYVVGIPTGDTKPNATQIVAGQNAAGGAPSFALSQTIPTSGTGVEVDFGALPSGLGSVNYDVGIVVVDAAGNASTPAWDDDVTMDTVLPTVTLTPADNATDVEINVRPKIVFSKAMDTDATATFEIRNTGGALIESFSPATEGTWSTTTLTDDTWTASGASNFANSAGISIRYSGFADPLGNVVAPVANDTGWDFDVVAAVPEPDYSVFSANTFVVDPSTATMWQDSAKTTLVTANDDPVGYYEDASGNGIDFHQTMPARRLIYKTDGVYHWLEVTSGPQFLTSVAGVALSTSGWGATAAFRWTTGSGGVARHIINANNATQQPLRYAGTNPQVLVFGNSTMHVEATTGTGPIVLFQDHVYSSVVDTTNVELFLDEVSESGPSAHGHTTLTTGTVTMAVGARVDAAEGAVGQRIYYAFFTAGAVTHANLADVETYAASRHP